MNIHVTETKNLMEWRANLARQRRKEMECDRRHNDYVVLGKQKGWRGNMEERGRLDRSR
jgi:hypothetical protein